jgi:uncharacterized protein HemX
MKLSTLTRSAVTLALVLPMAACLPGTIKTQVAKARQQHKDLASIAKTTRKATKKKPKEQAEVKTAYDRIVASMAQINEVLIQASPEDKPKADRKDWTSAKAEYIASKEAFEALAREKLAANGYAKSMPKPTQSFDPEPLWLEFIKLKPGKREGIIETLAEKLALTPWDNL